MKTKIKIASFDNKLGEKVFLEVEPDELQTITQQGKTRTIITGYYFLDIRGYRSVKYRNLLEARSNIERLYNSFNNFKLEPFEN